MTADRLHRPLSRNPAAGAGRTSAVRTGDAHECDRVELGGLLSLDDGPRDLWCEEAQSENAREVGRADAGLVGELIDCLPVPGHDQIAQASRLSDEPLQAAVRPSRSLSAERALDEQFCFPAGPLEPCRYRQDPRRPFRFCRQVPDVEVRLHEVGQQEGLNVMSTVSARTLIRATSNAGWRACQRPVGETIVARGWRHSRSGICLMRSSQVRQHRRPLPRPAVGGRPVPQRRSQGRRPEPGTTHPI